jgi:histone deacetylase complex regulatory component SIN3
MSRSRRVDALICESYSFLLEVREVFQDKREKYQQFLQLMIDFKDRTVDTEGVKEGVMELFKDHIHLISRFNIFLPPGHKIRLPSDDEQQHEDESAIKDEQKDDEQQSDDGLALKDEQKDDEE